MKITSVNPPSITPSFGPPLKVQSKIAVIFKTCVDGLLRVLNFRTEAIDQYIKVINDSSVGYISFDQILNRLSVPKDLYRGNSRIQQKIKEILDPFKSGIVKNNTIEILLSKIDEIDWSGYDGMAPLLTKINKGQTLSLSEQRGFEGILLNELEKIKSQQLKNSNKKFPIYWQDYLKLNGRQRAIQQKAVVQIYGKELFRALEKSDLASIDSKTVEQLDQIYNKKMNDFEQDLQDGDLIFTKLDHRKFTPLSLFSKDWIDYIILKGQRLSKIWLSGPKEKHSNAFTHVGMIIKKEGRAYLIEATPGKYHGDDVRMVELRGSMGRLTPLANQEYRVTRLKNRPLAKAAAHTAALLAQEIAYNEDQKPLDFKSTGIKYSKRKAIRSIFSKYTMNKKSQREIFELYAQINKNPLQLKESQKRTFYCSHFASMTIQFAEATPMIERLLFQNHISPKFAAMSDREIKIWARQMVRKFGKQLETLRMQFDSQKVSPQKLRAIIHTNSDFFEDAFSIKAP